MIIHMSSRLTTRRALIPLVARPCKNTYGRNRRPRARRPVAAMARPTMATTGPTTAHKVTPVITIAEPVSGQFAISSSIA